MAITKLVSKNARLSSGVKHKSDAKVIARRVLKRSLLYALLIIVVVIYAIPTYWVISTAFKTEVDAFASPPKWIVFKPTLDNFRTAFIDYGMLPNFKNSLIVTVGSTLLSLILGTPAAYALSRFSFKLRENFMFWFLSTRMAPPILVALPFFLISREILLYDTLILLIVVNVLTTIAWVVFMMRSFFDDIPIDIDEAARVDGASWIGALWRVVLPLAAPGLVATTVFSLIMAWNEYFFALVLTSVKAKTLPAAITSFMTVHGLLWGPMTAAGTVVMLPILIFTIWMQKHLIRGMTMGAIK